MLSSLQPLDQVEAVVTHCHYGTLDGDLESRLHPLPGQPSQPLSSPSPSLVTRMARFLLLICSCGRLGQDNAFPELQRNAQQTAFNAIANTSKEEEIQFNASAGNDIRPPLRSQRQLPPQHSAMPRNPSISQRLILFTGLASRKTSTAAKVAYDVNSNYITSSISSSSAGTISDSAKRYPTSSAIIATSTMSLDNTIGSTESTLHLSADQVHKSTNDRIDNHFTVKKKNFMGSSDLSSTTIIKRFNGVSRGASLGIPSSTASESSTSILTASDNSIASVQQLQFNSSNNPISCVSTLDDTSSICNGDNPISSVSPSLPHNVFLNPYFLRPSWGFNNNQNERSRSSTGALVPQLLAPLLPEDKSRKCLVLDLDETLVHSSFKPVQSPDFTVSVEIDQQIHSVYVLKRPGVDEFMRHIGHDFEVVVFTASLAKYADPVLDHLDTYKVIKHRLFRESCINYKGNYVKDLSLLGRDLRNVIIVDNSPASYGFHPSNAIPISSWFSDQQDTELLDLIPFLNDLQRVDNVMTVLGELDECSPNPTESGI